MTSKSKRSRLDTMIRFLATESLKKRLWRVCEERGLLPSQILRQAMINEIERLERIESSKTESAPMKPGR